MNELWAYTLGPARQPGPDYWNYFAHRLVELARISQGAVILDVGTDNGNVLFKAMEKAGPGDFGVGIDIDIRGPQEGLVELRNRGLNNVSFAQMNADILGFADETFDFALANFVGWDDFFDFERMQLIAPDCRLAEIRQVLKPGGQVGIGGWIEQSDIDWFAEAIHRHLPECFGSTGERISAYSKENVEGYRIIMQRSGFEDIRVQVETGSFVSPDGESWWWQMQHAAREFFKLVTDEDKLEDLKRQVFVELEQFRISSGIQFDKTVAFVFGTKS